MWLLWCQIPGKELMQMAFHNYFESIRNILVSGRLENREPVWDYVCAKNLLRKMVEKFGSRAQWGKERHLHLRCRNSPLTK